VADPWPSRLEGLQLERRARELEQELAALRSENAQLRDEVRRNRGLLDTLGPTFPPGHFHSPYPSLDEIDRYAERLWGRHSRELPVIDLNIENQLELLEALSAFHDSLPFPVQPDPKCRYHFENRYYSYGDATVLFSMTRYLKPARIVEVGSGFSSAALLDTNERFFNNAIECIFIDPHPDRLLALAWPGDLDRAQLMRTYVQDVPLTVFQSLEPNDVLLIDSSHVSKAGSDVNYLFFDVLPRLATGVHVHIHDIFYPFEYPRRWVKERRWAWNEAYLLRAFLEYNSAFEIRFFNNYLARFHADAIEQTLPTMLKNTGGSIWLRSLSGGVP
jgi:Methyltransferase domain